jgi:hypothetical protein
MQNKVKLYLIYSLIHPVVHSFIHLFRSLSCDGSVASSKVTPSRIAI